MSTASSLDDARPYHHGNLRGALLEAARDVIEEQGPAAVSLRDLARRLDVSHAAPTHHFGDKRGLMTALATQGFEALGRALAQAAPTSMVELGLAYVGVATARPADFAVMFRTELLDLSDAALLDARRAAWQALTAGVAALPGSARPAGDLAAARAAWSFVHGFATLWSSGAMPREDGEDPLEVARALLQQHFG